MTPASDPAVTDRARRTGARLPDDVISAGLREHYGLTVTAMSRLGGEVDHNMKVIDRTGAPHFVRVTRMNDNAADIAWQNTLLTHLANTVPDLPTPHLRRTLDGEDQVELRHEGADHVLRVMSWLPGRTLAEIADHSPELLRELGVVAARVSLGLSGLTCRATLQQHDWDMLRANEIVDGSLRFVADRGDADRVRSIMSWYDEARSGFDRLPTAVVHQDLNDSNVLADIDDDGRWHISGVVDVGDSMVSLRVTDLAIAAGYAMVRKADPLAAAAEVVAGFWSVLPLTAAELAVVYPMAAARLCMNAVTWTRRIVESDTEYGRTRSRHTWPTIRLLTEVSPTLAEATFRAACGLPPQLPIQADSVGAAIQCQFTGARHLDARPAAELYDEIDWTDPAALRLAVHRAHGDGPAVLGHLEASLVFAAQRAPGRHEPATVRLGSTILLPAGTPVTAPLEGTVVATDGALIVRHGTVNSVWWGLSVTVGEGAAVRAGDVLGRVHDGDVEPGFGTGVQVAVVTSTVTDVPRRIGPSRRKVWRQLAADPLPGVHAPAELTVGEVVAIRSRHIARSQRNYYRAPMSLVRGRDVWLYDEDGLGYLDSLNNVTHVGHAEPRVTRAATRQLRRLNTNSRFVYPQIATYAEKLVATLPEPLEVVFFVCTGSEANDLALRIARQVTGRTHIVNIDGAYHGNTGVVTGISPNRYKGPGGQGAPPTTHEVRIPDRYRGPYGYDDPTAGQRYAADAAAVIERIDADGRRPAAFIAESLMGSAGNIVFPDGYLAAVFAAARRAGALCVSDEVQVGLGRLGPWWGFQSQGVVPDIVTLGKPAGNGHPLAAVVTTRAIADAFDTGMKYFNTFGGNPVSCAIGETVLDIVERDGLRTNAVEVGAYFAAQLRELAQRQPLIGDVRAQGLYLGVELVRHRATKQPATDEAFAITELTKERGVVVYPNGVHDNVLKIKPPMTFRREHVDLYVACLDEVLSLPELSRPPVG